MVLQKFMKFLVKYVKYEDLDASLKEVGRILISKYEQEEIDS